MPIPRESDCSGANNCVCPYCGYEDTDSWELSGDSGIATCGTCGRDYHYYREVSVSYDTRPIVGPHPLSGCYLRDDALANPLEDEDEPDPNDEP